MNIFIPNLTTLSRRAMLKLSSASVAALALPHVANAATALNNKIHQSVCIWCYSGFMKREKMSTEQFVAACAELGVKAIDLAGTGDWPLLKKYGMICSMANSHSIPKGLNRVENHEACLAAIKKNIDAASEAGFPNVITFSGNTEGLDKKVGLENCVTALKQISGYAEEKKVTICMEFLNSINHKDYMGDSTAWFVELIDRVHSPRVKVLYDIYHAAMMKENPLEDIQKHAACWGHYHTGGMPGRNEIDASQTLDYGQLMKAVLATGYAGYVGQEFVPKKADALNSLKEAIAICDIV
jgi:hydroxypyruvate isomerase